MSSVDGVSGLDDPNQYDYENDELIEEQPEIRESAESVEKATFNPEEKVEVERSISEAENLETALTATISSVPETTETVTNTEAEEGDSEDPDRALKEVAEESDESSSPQASQTMIRD